MTTSLLQPNFSKGEIAETLAARTDLAAYQAALRKCRNAIVSQYGGVMNRPGTTFVAQTAGNEIARLIRFKFNSSDTYALEFTHLKMRVFRNGGIVLNSSGPSVGQPFELVTPFTRDQIFSLAYTQSADVMDIVHPSHKPQKLKRFDHDNWTISPVSLVPSIAAPTGITAANTGGSGNTQPWRYQITAVIDDGSSNIEESLPGTSNAITVYNTDLKANISWTAVTGATYYNVYKDNAGAGIYGFIGRATTTSFADVNITPTKADTPPTGTDPFVGDNNYPGAVGYYQQRLVYASTNNKPQTLWFSRPGIFNNFGYSVPIKDDDAITWTMASNEVNRVRHLAQLRTLLTFTDGAEWNIQGGAAGFTPKTINGQPQTYNGIGMVRPLIINSGAVYAQERGRKVTAYGYSIQEDGFTGSELSILSPHFLEAGSIIDWDYQRIPNSVIWAVRDDGAMLGITYMPEQDVNGWHLHTTDGLFKSVCAVPEGREDYLYVCVERVIGGVTKRYVERFASRTLPKYNGSALIDLAHFVDCGLSYDGRNTSATTMTLTGGTEWKYPEALTLTASTASFSAGDVGDEIQYRPTPDADPFRLKITAFTSSTVVTVRPQGVVPSEIRGAAFTAWAKARDTFSGLSHIEGKAVAILADGNVVGGKTVTGGSVTIPTPAAIVTIGLPYETHIETLEINAPQQETLLDKRKIIAKVTAVIEDSRGGLFGKSSAEADLFEVKQRTESDGYASIDAKSGKASMLINDTWLGTGRVTIIQRDPLPISILAIIPQADIGGAL